jgi:hypothetical protein
MFFEFYVLLGGLGLIAIAMLLAFKLGKSAEETDQLEEDIKATEKSNDIENKNKELTDAELRDSLRKFVRKK